MTEEEFKKAILESPIATITSKDGESVGITLDEASKSDIQYGIPAGGQKDIYKTSSGWSFEPANSVASITLDTDSGNIKITAPKAITETEEFKKVFDEDQLKDYSLAYKLNHDYKVKVREKNEETGKEEDKEVTIPEYVSRLNSSLTEYLQNLSNQRAYHAQLIQQYGEKAKNLTEEQIMMSAQGAKGAKATYLPDTIFTVSSFGNGAKNPFVALKNKRGDNDEISAEDLAEAWNRSNFGREEIAALMALINGHLSASRWNKENYYRDADGNLVYDRNSANEAAKLIAFKNYVLNNNPHAEWYQQAGDWIESAAINFDSAVTNVFANLAVIGELGVDLIPGVEAHAILDWKNDADQTMSNYNAISAQTWDALTNAQIWGYLAGTAFASWAAGKIGAGIARDLKTTEAATMVRTRQLVEEAGLVAKGSAAWNALSPQTMIALYESANEISLGTRLWLTSLSVANTALTATNVALSAINGAKNMNILTEYLFDTIHDAILYDGTTLRNVIDAVRKEGSDENKQEVINYWLGQFAENAKFWAPLGIARTSIKLSGKTTLGKAANVVTTKFVNKVAANVGLKKQTLKEKLAGGSVVKKLENEVEEAVSKNHFAKANRLQRKLDIENWNTQLREARQRLGKLELDWDGMKLTSDSLKKYQNYVSDIKVLENGIDAYNRNILTKIDEMTTKQIDPSTGKRMFLYPELGGANVKATLYYWDLVELNKKYDLSVAKNSMLNQDVVDYWMNSYYKRLADSFASSDGVNAAKAQNAAVILQKNIDALSEKVPQEIQDYIKNMLDRKIYQSWYFAQNEYGMSKGLTNRARTLSYQNNPIWQENGYMPIKVQHDVSGHWVEDSGRVDAVIEQDTFDALTFNVAEGQHYVDPEMVRQSRLRKMAQAEVNKELLKAYTGFSDSATKTVMVSGEETAYVDTVKRNEASLEKAVVEDSTKAFDDTFPVEAPVERRRKPIKNVAVSEADQNTIVSSMSPTQTANFLAQKKVLSSPNAKLTDAVTLENYDDWYNNKLNDSARKYLSQQQSLHFGDSAIDENGVKTKRVKIGDHEASIDYEIADRISAMNSDGYTSYNSHSGISVDHASTSDAGGGYIQFNGNIEPEKIERIKTAAAKAGMGITEDINPFYGKEIVVRQSNAVDGTQFEDIVAMANVKTYKKFKVPSEEIKARNGWMWLMDNEKDRDAWKFRENEIEKIYKEHGGHAQVDDAAIKKSWDTFFGELGYKNSGSTSLTFSQLESMVGDGGDDFEAGLQRAYLMGDKAFAKTSIMNEAARNLANGKDAFYQGVIMAKIKGETRNILKLDVDSFWDDMLPALRSDVDDYVAMVKSSPGAKAAMTTLSEVANGSEDAATYIALKQLEKEGNLKNAYDAIDKQIDGLKGIGDLPHDDVNLLKKKAHELLDDIIDTELNDAAKATRTINADLVDADDIYDKTKSLAKKITEAEGMLSEDYVMYLDDNGRRVYAQVDPAFASLFNTRAKITKAEASWLAKVNAYASRAFRYGTTSLNLSAFGNQMFRDFGNAILVGGSWQTIKTNADNMRDVFGDRIVEQIKAFDPDGYELRQLSKIAEESGQTVGEAAVSRELMRGAAIAETTTETSLYRDFMKQAYGGDSDTLLGNAKSKLKELWEKYDPDKYMNGKRENYLRNRVYASSLNDALKEGYSLSQARVYAEFAMNNATTNFSRQLYHMQAIADSTPYFRAAINGTKSFWRMWSLDPIGISGRIMGGLILPVMFLTGASLGSDENRKVYKNIPEYQKADSLVFVINGEAVSIPLPQELSPIVAPFRQFVEYLYDANQNDFWELMANDLLGFSPYDMTGFTAIDYDKMISDPTFFDRISRGFARLFSQMAPIPLKTAYMIASGTDPYTGKWLRDPSYAYWNDETGSIETMDYYQSTFATYFAKLFPKTNPAIADKVISGVLGTTGSNLLGDIATFIMEGPEAALLSAGKNIIEQATNPVSVEEYDLVDAIWQRAVRQMTNEKKVLLDSEEMKTLNSELSQTKDPEKRQKLLAQRQTLTDSYKEKVAQMVERLNSVYHGSFDRKKFAAVIALLNFNSDAAYQSGSQFSSNIASEMYWNGRDEAVHTMERLGISGTSDMSIFGYLTTDKNGNPVVKYSSPIAIMDMKAQWQSQDDINAANIKALLSENEIYDAHKAVSGQISKIYDSKKTLTNQDYANIDAIKINWNAQLAKTIAPYIATMTPEAAINNKEVLNLLYPYVEVPNSWANKSVGSRGNKKQAYYESWVKSMFSINDPYKGQY